MKLLLKRNQKSGLMGGGMRFSLDVRAELSDEERGHVDKYKLGKTLLYTNMEDRGSGLVGMVSRALQGIEITVDHLVSGKQVECKDIVEMITIEDQVKEATKTFKTILDMAATFGGEELIELS